MSESLLLLQGVRPLRVKSSGSHPTMSQGQPTVAGPGQTHCGNLFPPQMVWEEAKPGTGGGFEAAYGGKEPQWWVSESLLSCIP